MDKACFQRDMAYGNFKGLPRKTAYDKVLSDKGFNIVKNPKYNLYQCGLVSMIYNCFDKRSLAGAVTHARSEKFATQGKFTIKMKLSQTNNQQENYRSHLLKNYY